MFRNYLTIAIRHLLRNKFFSLINIIGLSIGIAAIILIMLYILHEFSFDRFHKNREQIYRVMIKEEKGDITEISAITTAAVGPSMLEEFPEVKSMVRFSNPNDGYFTLQDRNYYESGITYADSSLFEVFSFKLVSGNPLTALSEPYSIVFTRTTAEKIFGDKEPVNQMVKLNDKDLLKVTGIMEDVPSNSQLRFNAVISFSTLYNDPNMFLDWNGGYNYYTYVLLHENADQEQLVDRFPDFMEKHINYLYRPLGFVLSLMIEPISKVHLFSSADYDLDTKGNLTNICIFSAIAIFIMLIACINFMNLSTARSIQRAREVGLRKVTGATGKDIILQFLGESVLVSIIAFIFALVIVQAVLPDFNNMISGQLKIFSRINIILIPAVILLVFLTGIIAGSYPAFYMTRFQPVRIIKGDFISGKGKPVVRNILVVFQFFISACMIICTLIILNQVNFLRKKPPGFNQDNVVLISLLSQNIMDKSDLLENEFLTIPGVSNSGACTGIPGRGLTMNGYLPEGLKEPIMIHVTDVDERFLDLLDIPIVKGVGFSKESQLDNTAYLINETLAKQLGWDDPVGKTIYRDGGHKVIGVVKDFHFATLHQPIQPLIITNEPWLGFNFLAVKISGDEPDKSLSAIENKWKEIAPSEPFNYNLLENYIREGYEADRQFSRVLSGFSFLAVFIACLGLLGLASYSAARRRHEIGIRKVFGAGTKRIVYEISFDFARFVLMANIMAWPVAWLIMDKWLQHYAFRVEIHAWIFIVTTLLTLLISWITIAYQTLKLAGTNPSEVLKYE